MRRALTSVLIVCALLPAAASAATVSGKVAGGRGYTVLAMAANGRSASARIGASGTFSLKVPGTGATLQLIKPNGAYFGPVVLGKAGKKAIVRLSARGGRLGRIALKTGFASAHAPKKAVSRSGAVATGKHGAPLGAGRLGLVKMKAGHAKARIAAAGSGDPGADPDGDGIPSAFDADDNGNGSMDGVDPQTAHGSGAGLFSDVEVMMSRAINANAGGLSKAAIDEFVKNNTSLNFYLDDHYANGASVSAVNVDCGTLVYCRPGDGTATMGDGGNSPTGVQDQKWVTYDNDHDGLPDVPANTNGGGPGVHSIEIKPNVGTSDIHAGDLYQVKFTTPGGVVSVPTALSLIFASTPALASYDAGAGTAPISYPAADGSVPGSDQDPIRMSGDKLTLSFWRPQRAGLGGEPAYVDMGHLRYGVPMSDTHHEFGCGVDRYSNVSPDLRPAPASSDSIYNALFPFQDRADDAAPNAANTLHFTLDLGGCLRANGVDVSQPVRLPLQAVDEARPGGTDRTGLTIAVCLPGCTMPAHYGPQDGNGGQQQGDGGQQGNGGQEPGNGGGQGGKPDLAIDSVTGTDNAGNCDLTVNIANRGTAMAPPTSVAISVAGGPSATFQAQNVDAGGHVTATGGIAGACAGQTLTATADSTGSVDEFAEDNNSWSGTL